MGGDNPDGNVFQHKNELNLHTKHLDGGEMTRKHEPLRIYNSEILDINSQLRILQAKMKEVEPIVEWWKNNVGKLAGENKSNVDVEKNDDKFAIAYDDIEDEYSASPLQFIDDEDELHFAQQNFMGKHAN